MHNPSFDLLKGTALNRTGFKNACQMGLLFDETHDIYNELLIEPDE